MIPACTVVIPCRNRHDQVVNAVRSAVSLSFVRQVIVADDGSVPPIDLRRFNALSGSHKITVIPNRLLAGAQGARVSGAMAATEDIILFLDSDDELLAVGVAGLLARVSASEDIALAYGNVRTGATVSNFLRLQGHGFRAVLKNLSLCPFSGMMVRRTLVPWEGLDLRLPAWQDDDFALSVCKDREVAFVDVISADTRCSADSISCSPAKQLVGLRMLVEKWRPEILSEFGHFRLFLWTLRRMAISCFALSESWRTRATLRGRRNLRARIGAAAAYVVGKAIQLALRPFFDRIYA